jgi:hypothetical protein
MSTRHSVPFTFRRAANADVNGCASFPYQTIVGPRRVVLGVALVVGVAPCGAHINCKPNVASMCSILGGVSKRVDLVGFSSSRSNLLL